MGKLSTKEKNLLKFVVGVLGPLALAFAALVYYFELYNNPLQVVGFITTSIISAKIGSFLFEKFTRPQTWGIEENLVEKYGKWAIITGATGGIGGAFAHEFARRGMNILIIARNPKKLEETKEGILKINPTVKVEILVYDFSNQDKEVSDKFYAELEEKAEEISKDGGIGMLINNVGINQDDPEYLYAMDKKVIQDIMQINIFGTVNMTRSILPILQRQKKGSVINISSGSGNHPTPLLSCYASTKVFIREFSQSLYYEMKEFGVNVLVLTPYYITTNMFPGKAGYIACTPERFVKDVMLMHGRYSWAYPWICHAFLGNLSVLYPKIGDAMLMSMKKNKARAEAKRKQAN